MKLRKMITVSAAALMLAGVGASATSQMPSANASRRTVRVTRLNNRKTRLNRQIRRDRTQVKQINREIARLTHKNVRRGKRSKRVTKRHQRSKKAKLTPQQKQQQQMIQKIMQARIAAAKKQRTVLHVAYGKEVYKVEMNGIGQTLAKKPYMKVTTYRRTTQKPLRKVVSRLNNLAKPAKGNQAKLQKIESSKRFQQLYNNYRNLSLYVPKANATAKK